MMMGVGRSKKALLCVCVFLLLFFSFSYYSKNLVRESVNTFLSAVVICIICLAYKRKVRTNNYAILIVILLIVLGSFSSLLAGDSITAIISPAIDWLLAFLFVSVVDFADFKNAYVKVITFTCLLSIIAELLYYGFPSALSIFPTLQNTAGNYVRNLWFVVVPTFGTYRLQGFAWEPGVFQFLINVAIFFVLSANKWDKKNVFALAILIVSLVLTLSTTGYIVGAVVFLLFGLRKYEEKKTDLKIVFKLLVSCVALFAAVVVLFNVLPDTIGGSTFGFSKLESFFKGGSSSDHIDSASVRYDSIYYPLVAFISNPVFGVGYTGLNNLSVYMHHNMTTCTPVNYFAIYGALYGAIIMVLFYGVCSKLSKKFIKRVLYFVGFLIAVSSEQFVNYLFLDIIICFGIYQGVESANHEIVSYQ